MFRAALTALMERHEVLRTCLGEMDGRPVQVVHGSVETPLAVSDLSSFPLPEAERGARAMLEEDSAQRFDLSAAPLFKVRVVRLAEDDHVIGICLHHVAIDGWSTGVLFRDLGELYQACASGRAAALPPLTAQYADFATWQRGRLTGEPLDELLGYWTEALRDAPEMLELQPGQPRPAERSYKGGRFDVDLTPDVLRTVRELARQEGGTLFMVLFAAFAVLVARRAGRRDFVIGVPVAGRSHPDLENLVGFFVNTLPERLDLSGEPTFRGLVHHVRRVHLGALAHEDLPFERLVGELGPDRATDRLPLVQVAFNFQNAPFAPLRFGEVEATLFETDHEVARFDMVAELYEHQDGVHCMFHYSADLFEPAYVRQFADEYLDLVRRLAAEPDGPVFAAADGAVDVPAQVRQALDTSSLSGCEPCRARAEGAASRRRTVMMTQGPLTDRDATGAGPNRVEDVFPLTAWQQAALLADPGRAGEVSVAFDGPCDLPALVRALAGLVRRHPVLRSTVDLPPSGGPVHLVRPAPASASDELALTDLLWTPAEGGEAAEVPTDPLGMPASSSCTVRRSSGGRVAVSLRLAGPLLDRRSGALLTTDLLRGYGEELHGRDPRTRRR
ncbi:condensation domain-containing protein [Actinomadura luteofluorescens]|uniref:condensation domain-containing protein n=1 Tax=Actinomadura luteofluorescens TaxID=46163 RepID=UPI00363650EB